MVIPYPIRISTEYLSNPKRNYSSYHGDMIRDVIEQRWNLKLLEL